tara:strand:+ start:129 stop:1337 length:1209 start_codon:yes stop_codon:yes gene_type:complete
MRSSLTQIQKPLLPTPSTSSIPSTPIRGSSNYKGQSVLTPVYQKNTIVTSTSSTPMEESLMKMGNETEKIEKKLPNFANRNKVLPLNSGLSKVVASPSTAIFSTFEGEAQNQDIEKALLDRDFISTEKILTRDTNGNIVCHFIKARDKLGHVFYVELDTTSKDGMGFLKVTSQDQVFTQSKDASVVPYSLKIGSFEASNNDLYGIGFECNNSICVMSRKNNSLDPVETVFTQTKGQSDHMAIQDKHPVPFPVVKMTEILANPKMVEHNIACSHNRMRNVAFNSCSKDVKSMKANVEDLETEVLNFEQISGEVSQVLGCTINELENMHSQYEKTGVQCSQDTENIKAIRFNLNKRQDLVNDYLAMCHSMRERAEKIAVLAEELKAFNQYSQTLFTGLSSVFTE